MLEINLEKAQFMIAKRTKEEKIVTTYLDADQAQREIARWVELHEFKSIDDDLNLITKALKKNGFIEYKITEKCDDYREIQYENPMKLKLNFRNRSAPSFTLDTSPSSNLLLNIIPFYDDISSRSKADLHCKDNQLILNHTPPDPIEARKNFIDATIIVGSLFITLALFLFEEIELIAVPIFGLIAAVINRFIPENYNSYATILFATLALLLSIFTVKLAS